MESLKIQESEKLKSYFDGGLKMNNYKRYMLKFYHENFGHRTFFFDTKKEMMDFVNKNEVRVEKMFYLSDIYDK